jgi:hypothetical protein
MIVKNYEEKIMRWKRLLGNIAKLVFNLMWKFSKNVRLSNYYLFYMITNNSIDIRRFLGEK